MILHPSDAMLIIRKENLCICLMCTNKLMFCDHNTKATMLQPAMFRHLTVQANFKRLSIGSKFKSRFQFILRIAELFSFQLREY